MTDKENSYSSLVHAAVGWLPEQQRRSLDIKVLRERLRQELVVGGPDKLPTGKALQAIEDLLAWELGRKEIVNALEMPRIAADTRLAVWRGDITTLRIGAIVNAANEAGLGCFQPSHRCIDNIIHCAAGPGLRAACKRELQAPHFSGKLPTGHAFSTAGFSLPAELVIHTPGPVGEHPEKLALCYRSVLEVCKAKRVRSVAFCCISTGLFGYPADRAAEVAISTVRRWLDEEARQNASAAAEMADLPEPLPSLDLVVFNVFLQSDLDIYRELLGADADSV